MVQFRRQTAEPYFPVAAIISPSGFLQRFQLLQHDVHTLLRLTMPNKGVGASSQRDQHGRDENHVLDKAVCA